MQLIFPVASAAKVSIYAEVDDSKEAVSLFAAVKADQQEEENPERDLARSARLNRLKDYIVNNL